MGEELKDYFLHDGAYHWWDKGLKRDFLPAETLLLRNVLPKGLIADIGIGKARVELNIGKDPYNFIGVDISSAMLREARSRLLSKSLSVDLIQADAEALPFRPKIFDSSFCIETLMHVPNADAVISEMRRMTRGDIFVHVNIKNLRYTLALLFHGHPRGFLTRISGDYPSIRRLLRLRTIWKSYTRKYVQELNPRQEWEVSPVDIVVRL